MLLQIRDYIRREKIASNQQIAREFNLDPQALEPMLNRWLQKGVISAYPNKNSCGSSCFKCKIPISYYTCCGN